MNHPRYDGAKPVTRWPRMKWYHVYFLMAAFNLFTVSFSLVLNHRLVATHKRTVEGNLQWVARLQLCDNLGNGAAEVVAPGTDLLKNHDVDAATRKMRAALSRFTEKLDTLREELKRNVPPQDAAPLLGHCATVRKENDDVVERLNSIFSLALEGKFDEAGKQVVTLSRDYDQVLRALDSFRMDIRAVRKGYMDAQAAEASKLAQYEWWLGGLIVLMVAGITVYGVMMARCMAAAELDLRASEERLHAAFENAATGMALVAPDGLFLKVNRALCEMVGYSAEELLARTFHEITHPDDLQKDLVHVEQLLTGQIRNYHTEKRYIRKDGKVVYAVLSVSMVRDRQGQPLHFIAQTQDITASKRAEAELEDAHKQLVDISRQAGMAEVATNILHNVGNVLNSVNVSANLVESRIRNSKVSNLAKTVGLLREHENDLAAFLTTDPKGEQLCDYLDNLAHYLGKEQAGVLKELESLNANVEHIKEIVTMQQSYARASSIMETLPIVDLVEDALCMNVGALNRQQVKVVRKYTAKPSIAVDKHKVLQILVNLIGNAKYALDEGGQEDKRLTVGISVNGNRLSKISVTDNGVGIPPENLTRIFEYGFTTRRDGHGFGLHSSALAAKEMGGSLSVHSDGPGQGATFTLSLPVQQKDGNS